ncbi:MAG TPA: ribosomal protein S18-alanine N-acetyltransferase [Gammaproteobacteria bacterium]|nr:ribosomal protein S18-alanine N-acetyltransferase [Gammaproteobacteria bacterium]
MSAILKYPAIRMRPMSEGDIDTIMSIERRAYDYPWTEGIFRDCLRIGYCCWVSLENNAIAGYSVMAVGGGESHILNICIRPESRKRGFGRSLLTHMLELAREHNAEMTVLEVRPSNEVALRLYRDLGFNEIGLRKFYYPAPHGKEDAIVLGKCLL